MESHETKGGVSEEWRDIPGWEGLYQASSKGRIRSLSRKLCTGRTIRQRVLRARHSVSPANVVLPPCVRLCDMPRKQLKTSVGRLVLMAFVGDQPGMVAHYKDGDRLNCSIENLEWSTIASIVIGKNCVLPWQQ